MVTGRSGARAAGVVLALVAVLSTAVGACSSGDGGGEADEAEGTTTTAPTTTAEPPPTAPVGQATGGVTVEPDPVPVTPGGTAMVTVTWEGQTPESLVFVSICRKPTSDPSFQVGADCSPLSELTPNGTADGAGTVQLEVFRGPTPDGDGIWGCFAEADEAPPGVQKNTTCYVRVTNDVVLNNDDATEVPFTIVDG